MQLYKDYGFYKEKLFSLELTGKEGQEKIQKSIEYLRDSMSNRLDDVKIVKKMDYKLGLEKDLINIKESRLDLPKSNVLKFILEDNSWFVVRPSGTEPKMKIYLSVTGNSLEDSEEKMKKFESKVKEVIDQACNN
jgi:phosphoglucomutase